MSGGGHMWGFSQSSLQSAQGTAESEFYFDLQFQNIRRTSQTSANWDMPSIV
jgi:hypothetical protein